MYPEWNLNGALILKANKEDPLSSILINETFLSSIRDMNFILK